MIQDFADWLVYGIFGLSAGTSLGTAVNFFFYDTVKILILLFFISVLIEGGRHQRRIDKIPVG